MLSSRWLLFLLLVILSAILFALVQAEGGWRRLPVLLGQECPVCGETLEAMWPTAFTDDSSAVQ